MFKKVINLYVRYGIVKKIEQLHIAESGIDPEGDPYVKLENGTIFYGSQQKFKRDRLLYKFLNSTTRSVLSLDALQVAMDIVIRYVEGGLKYKGPKKQMQYTVKVGDHVAEMGAFQGFCSLKLAQQVTESGQVICIEPNRDNFRLLEKNMKSNNCSHVKCVNYGVWDSESELTFNMRDNDGQSSSVELNYKESDASYSIKAKPLDSIFNEIGVFPRDFMIVQLNGAEINALKGLNTFNPRNLAIAARYDTKGVDAAKEIQDHLIAKGYETSIVEHDYVFAKLDA